MIQRATSEKGFTLTGIAPPWMALGATVEAVYDRSGTLLHAEVKTRWNTSYVCIKGYAVLDHCKQLGKKWKR